MSYEAFLQIHEIVNRPNSYTIGYNLLKFDDLFLRFGFYRNGLEPYNHQWKNDCQRLDLLAINRLYYLFDTNNPITYPHKPDGTPVFKLDQLIELNELAEGMAHDAGVDVEASIELARRLRESNPKLWDYCLGWFHKTTDAAWSYSRTTSQEGGFTLLVDFYLKYTTGYQTPIYIHSVSKQEVYYLRLDSKELTKLSPKNLLSKAAKLVKTKKNGEPGFVLPYSLLQSEYFDPNQHAIIEQNVQFVTENKALIDQLFANYQPKVYPEIEDLDVDAALYQEGFWTQDERIFFKGFHLQTSAQQKIDFVKNSEHKTQRSKELAQRILFRNFTNAMIQEGAYEAFYQFIKTALQPVADEIAIDYLQKQKLIAEEFLTQADRAFYVLLV